MWEIKTLEQHYCSDIQEAVKVFNQPLDRQEKDLNAYLDSCYADRFDQELVPFETDGAIPLSFKAPSQIFDCSVFDERFWVLE